MANGAATTTAARLLGRFGFDVVSIGDRPNGRNINLECGSTHPAGLAAAVVRQGCRLGAAFDGDGDRAILVDAAGRIVDGDAILLILALAYHRAGRLTGDTVVATVMSNLGLEVALRDRGITLVRTAVGDRHVMDAMVQGHVALGGEQSGHVILADHLPTGDGLATLLAVLGVMAETGHELSELAGDLVTFPQTLVNVRVRDRPPLEEVPEVLAAIARVEAALGRRGRVLVRYSGTEPLLRVMIEGEDQASVQMWAEERPLWLRPSTAMRFRPSTSASPTAIRCGLCQSCPAPTFFPLMNASNSLSQVMTSTPLVGFPAISNLFANQARSSAFC
jgi:phosphoglucosamine mutase